MRTQQILHSTALSAVLVVFAVAALAQAPPQAQITWDIAGCPARAVASIHHLTLIEIESTNPSAEISTLRIEVVCGAREASLSVLSGGEHRTSRKLDLTGVEESDVPRLISLALAELAADVLEARAASLIVPGPDPTPDPSPEPTPDPEPEVVEAPEEASVELSLETGGRSFASHPSLLLGVGLTAHLMVDQPAGIRLSIGAESSTSEVSLGSVSTLLISGALGGEAHFRTEGARLSLGGGLRAGAARLAPEASASTTQSSDLSAVWGGPFASATLGLAATDLLVLKLGSEIGMTLWEVGGIVDERPAVALEGPWVAFSLSIGAAL